MSAQQARIIPNPLCAFTDLVDGKSRGFDPLNEGRDTMFVVRQGPRIYAYRNNCPHYDNARMAWRKDAFLTHDEQQIMCSAHGAVFTITTGYCEAGPCVGQSLEAVAVAVRDGEVFIQDPYRPGLPARMGNGAKPPSD